MITPLRKRGAAEYTVKWEVRQPRGSEVESAQGKNNYLLEISTDVYSQEKKSRSQTSLGECRLEGGYSLSHSEETLYNTKRC